MREYVIAFGERIRSITLLGRYVLDIEPIRAWRPDATMPQGNIVNCIVASGPKGQFGALKISIKGLQASLQSIACTPESLQIALPDLVPAVGLSKFRYPQYTYSTHAQW